MSDQNAVKKIAPYPIPVDVMKVEGQPPLKENIVRLTEIGLMMRVDPHHFYKIGEDYTLHFQLPVISSEIHALGKVIKTYSNPREHLVEIHFRSLGDRELQNIHHFLVKIGHHSQPE